MRLAATGSVIQVFLFADDDDAWNVDDSGRDGNNQ